MQKVSKNGLETVALSGGVQPVKSLSRTWQWAAFGVTTLMALVLMFGLNWELRQQLSETQARVARLENELDEALRAMQRQITELSEPYLGVSVSNVGLLRRWFAGLSGAYVDAVERGSPAEAAGLRPGDIILALDGVTVEDRDALNWILKAKEPGDLVNIEVWRGGRTLVLEARLGRRPKR